MYFDILTRVRFSLVFLIPEFLDFSCKSKWIFLNTIRQTIKAHDCASGITFLNLPSLNGSSNLKFSLCIGSPRSAKVCRLYFVLCCHINQKKLIRRNEHTHQLYNLSTNLSNMSEVEKGDVS
jgi:hypothetical protein